MVAKGLRNCWILNSSSTVDSLHLETHLGSNILHQSDTLPASESMECQEQWMLETHCPRPLQRKIERDLFVSDFHGLSISKEIPKLGASTMPCHAMPCHAMPCHWILQLVRKNLENHLVTGPEFLVDFESLHVEAGFVHQRCPESEKFPQWASSYKRRRFYKKNMQHGECEHPQQSTYTFGANDRQGVSSKMMSNYLWFMFEVTCLNARSVLDSEWTCKAPNILQSDLTFKKHLKFKSKQKQK